MLITRRSLLRGLFAAPAIIAVDRLMPVKSFPVIWKMVGRRYRLPNGNVLLTEVHVPGFSGRKPLWPHPLSMVPIEPIPPEVYQQIMGEPWLQTRVPKNLPTIGRAMPTTVDPVVVAADASTRKTILVDCLPQVPHPSLDAGGAVAEIAANPDLSGSRWLDLHRPEFTVGTDHGAATVTFDFSDREGDPLGHPVPGGYG